MADISQIVIFGASGDLTSRKLIPALLRNFAEQRFHKPLQIIGVSRSARSDVEWRESLDEWIPDDLRAAWSGFAPSLSWRAVDASVGEQTQGLADHLEALAEGRTANRLFYLALKPSLFAPTIRTLSSHGLLDGPKDPKLGWRRVVVEKPFGRDLPSARALNRELLEHVREDQLFRIDHYLGKETVQNILSFRFQNAIFEPLWNRKHIESVEISVCETVAMEGKRGAYYDSAGAIRDMVQNHVLQILALVAMEPPTSMAADAVRSEKVKVLTALRPMRPDQVAEHVVRGQYLASPVRDRGYLEEEGVDPASSTETFVAVRAQIDNWRWSGIPFLLRSGKALHKRYTEVVLRFRTPPLDLLAGPSEGEHCALRPNDLRLLIQPEEGVRLSFLVKRPGPGMTMVKSELGFDYSDLDAGSSPPAYQRLLLDAIEGNATLFIRGDEVEAAWAFVDSIRAGWDQEDVPMFGYEAGSHGPEEANNLFVGCEGTWSIGP
ncbi:MAG: glucose-6-phosphate dehydrogenase [Deltaproteobacteria bacterium]|nr:glucose-6-phosphate dehydrogenase [Deltaproteobacteria bacterium]